MTMSETSASTSMPVVDSLSAPPKPPPSRRAWRLRALQILIVATLLAAWQWLPTVTWLPSWTILNRAVVSSPTAVWKEIGNLATGAHHSDTIWPYLGRTLLATAIGVAAGIVIGAGCGLLLSSSRFLAGTFMPFFNAFNAVPRIALIPIIVIVLGQSLKATSFTSFLVVYFIVFFNAYEGGISIRKEILENARLLGAGPASVMVRVRLPYVTAWAFAAVPNAISFGLVGVVAAELLTGVYGIGNFLVVAMDSANTSEVFAICIILGVVGLILITVSSYVRRRVLHWWDVT